MIVNVFPCSSDTFVASHGVENAKRYLKLAYEGLQLEKSLAKKVLPDVSSQLNELGSLYVCLEEDVAEFRSEYEKLVSLGAMNIECWEKEQVQAAAGNGFHLGIYFPHDAVIDSTSYSKGLLKAAALTGNLRLTEECSPARKVETHASNINGRHAVVTLRDGTVLRSKHVVVATGGMFLDPNLAGVLSPCWSYLVSIPEPSPAPNDNQFKFNSSNTMNFFSWNFTHDWCLTKGHLRCSGEDHYSALKPPRGVERCKALADWTVGKLPYLLPNNGTPLRYLHRYGVYSETPDHCPLVGTPHPDSRVFYLLGCNAWGQASLSYAASLVPKVLGYVPFDADSKDNFECLNIRRFALLDAVLGAEK
jgi:glycine/D-amino acid oxidase-like deaminating enzyme